MNEDVMNIEALVPLGFNLDTLRAEAKTALKRGAEDPRAWTRERIVNSLLNAVESRMTTSVRKALVRRIAEQLVDELEGHPMARAAFSAQPMKEADRG